MAYSFRIVIFGPPGSGKSTLLKKIYELYREASLHNIRFLGGSWRSGIDYCAFNIGDFKYEVYAPPGTSSIKVFRNKIVKNADGIIFVIPAQEDMIEKTASFILELRRLLFDRHKDKVEDFPVIYAVNIFEKTISDSIKNIIEQLNLPPNSIVVTFSPDSEQDIRSLFGKITLLSSLRRLDSKSYYLELEKLRDESQQLIQQIVSPPPPAPVVEAPAASTMPPSLPPPEAVQKTSEEISLPEVPTIETEQEHQPIQQVPQNLLMHFPPELKNKLLQNYINEVVLVDFDRAIGHIPRGYAFGSGKVISYVSNPLKLVELSIIAKHSLGFLLTDGFTFVGLIHLPMQGFIILETTSSHIKKMLNLVKNLKKVFSKYKTVDEKTLIRVLNEAL